jgi:hypothetical protein
MKTITSGARARAPPCLRLCGWFVVSDGGSRLALGRGPLCFCVDLTRSLHPRPLQRLYNIFSSCFTPGAQRFSCGEQLCTTLHAPSTQHALLWRPHSCGSIKNKTRMSIMQLHEYEICEIQGRVVWLRGGRCACSVSQVGRCPEGGRDLIAKVGFS